MENHKETFFVSSNEACSQLKNTGNVKDISLGVGETVDTIFNEIPAKIFRLKHLEDTTGLRINNYAFLINFNGVRIFHPGDITYAWDKPLLEKFYLDKEEIDVVFVPYFDLSETSKRYITEVIKPKYIIAMHIPPKEYKNIKPRFLNVYSGGILLENPLDEIVLNDNETDYLGQTPPGNTPEIFAPGIVSVTGRYEYGLSVSPNNDEIYFTAEEPGDGLMVVRKVNGIWGKPELANLRGKNRWEFEAFFTPDGSKLYFTSETNDTSKFWFMVKDAGTWSKPKYLPSPINNTSVMWCTFTFDETMYYGNNNNFQIHRARLTSGKYTEIENLGFKGTHPTIAPDESFFLFNSRSYGGYGKSDILVVFKNENGSWGTPINLGDKINTEYSETCASLSPDGKYIFFSRYNEPENKSNIYWVSSDIITRLAPVKD